MTYAAVSKSYGIQYTNNKVQINELVTGIPAIILNSSGAVSLRVVPHMKQVAEIGLLS
jgi:hypothetical protein